MVKNGYKQTDIGVIPKDWEVKSYDEVFNFLTTATYSRVELTSEDSIQYLHYGDIHTKHHFSLNFDKVRLPTIQNELLKKYPLLQDGDIVMADTSEDYEGICKSVEIKNIRTKKVISGLHTFLLREKNNTFVNAFRAYLSSNILIRKQFNSQATGMKVFGVSKGNLKNIQIPIPPKEEQKAIAKALSDTDELISSLEKLISKKEAIKQGTMQQLLTGKKRLSGFSGEWEEKRLEEIIKLQGGYAFQSAKFKKQGIKIVRISNISDKKVDLIDVVFYEKIKISKEFYVKYNDILIAMSGATTGKIGKYKDNIFAYMNQRVGKFINLDSSKIDINFIYQLLLSRNFTVQLDKMLAQGAQPNISGTQIESMIFYFPLFQEQNAISQILSDMDNEIETLKSKLSKTKAIKNGMMNELLTGKTRLLAGEKNEYS